MAIERMKELLPLHAPGWGMLTRRNILSGLLFIAIAAAGLWISRNYPVGTALRMGTGYVPRMLLWLLLALGAITFVQGLGEPDEKAHADRTSILRPLFFVSLSLAVFGLTIEQLGLIIAIALLIGIGSLASRDLRVVEVMITAAVLIVLSVVIFVLGLGMTIPIWPEL